VYSGGILKIQGIYLATITEVYAWRENETIIDAIRRLAPPDITTKEHGGNEESPLDAFCSTLNGGLFSRSYIPDDTNSPNFERFQDIVRHILDPQFNVSRVSKSARRELDNAEKYLRGRTFFRTDNGSMGLAPLAAEAGDCIMIMLGGRSAFVLRSSGTGQFQMIGESYIHGFMYGEALLGAMPN
jgi:hypothetical protein